MNTKKVRVTWSSDDTRVTGFIIRRKIDNEDNYSTVAELLNDGVREYIDYGVDADMQGVSYTVSKYMDTPHGRFESPIKANRVNYYIADYITPWVVSEGAYTLSIDDVSLGVVGDQSDMDRLLTDTDLDGYHTRLYGPIIINTPEGSGVPSFTATVVLPPYGSAIDINDIHLWRSDAVVGIALTPNGGKVPILYNDSPEVVSPPSGDTSNTMHIYYSEAVESIFVNEGDVVSGVDPDHPIELNGYSLLFASLLEG